MMSAQRRGGGGRARKRIFCVRTTAQRRCRVTAAASGGEASSSSERVPDVQQQQQAVSPDMEFGAASEVEYEEFQRELEEEELELERAGLATEEELLNAEALQDVFKNRKDIPGHYEVMYIIHPDEIDNVDTIMRQVVDEMGKEGVVHRLQDMGIRQMAYAMGKGDKRTDLGNYVLMNFECKPAQKQKMTALCERLQRESVLLRFLFQRLNVRFPSASVFHFPTWMDEEGSRRTTHLHESGINVANISMCVSKTDTHSYIPPPLLRRCRRMVCFVSIPRSACSSR